MTGILTAFIETSFAADVQRSDSKRILLHAPAARKTPTSADTMFDANMGAQRQPCTIPDSPTAIYERWASNAVSRCLAIAELVC